MTNATHTPTPTIPSHLIDFFWIELRNTDQMARDETGSPLDEQEDPDEFPCTVATAMDSLAQAPGNIVLRWLGLADASPEEVAEEMALIALFVAGIDPRTDLTDLV